MNLALAEINFGLVILSTDSEALGLYEVPRNHRHLCSISRLFGIVPVHTTWTSAWRSVSCCISWSVLAEDRLAEEILLVPNEPAEMPHRVCVFTIHVALLEDGKVWICQFAFQVTSLASCGCVTHVKVATPSRQACNEVANLFTAPLHSRVQLHRQKMAEAILTCSSKRF